MTGRKGEAETSNYQILTRKSPVSIRADRSTVIQQIAVEPRTVFRAFLKERFQFRFDGVRCYATRRIVAPEVLDQVKGEKSLHRA